MIILGAKTMKRVVLLFAVISLFAVAALASAQAAQTITQSTSNAITPDNSVTCGDATTHAASSYFRVFDLAAFGIDNGMDVSQVEIGIEEAAAGAGGQQPIAVRLHSKAPAAALTYANLAQIGAASSSVNNGTQFLFSVPVTGSIGADLDLVVEVITPDGTANGNLLVIGSNAAAENAPSYIVAAACGSPQPATTDSIGAPDMHIVMSVTGVPRSATAPEPQPGVTVSNGIFVPNLGEVLISTSDPTPVYESAGGGLVRVGVNELWLPQDNDGNGFDTYVVTDIQVVGDEVWAALFIGSDTWVWVPFAAVTPLNYFAEESMSASADVGFTSN